MLCALTCLQVPRRRERGGVAGPGSTTIRLFRSKEVGYVAMRESEDEDGADGRSVRQRVGEPSMSRGPAADEPTPQEPVPEDSAESDDESEDDEEIGDP